MLRGLTNISILSQGWFRIFFNKRRCFI